jgi:hypothetical protein
MKKSEEEIKNRLQGPIKLTFDRLYFDGKHGKEIIVILIPSKLINIFISRNGGFIHL